MHIFIAVLISSFVSVLLSFVFHKKALEEVAALHAHFNSRIHAVEQDVKTKVDKKL